MFNKITEAQIESVYVQSAADTLSGTAQENKKVFDKLPLLTIENYNALIDAIESDGASGVGVKDYIGGTEVSSTVTAQLVLTAAKFVDIYTKSQIDSMFDGEKTGTVSDISYNKADGSFTVTKADGTSYTIDTDIEKIPVSVELVEEADKIYLKITNYDGSYSQADVTKLLNIYSVESTSAIDMALLDGVIKATLKNGSVTMEHLATDVTAAFEEYKQACASYALSAQTNATNAAASEANAKSSETNAKSSETMATAAATAAKASETNAKASETNAKTSELSAAVSKTASESWAVGGTGTRAGEDTNNAKYWAEQAQSSASGDYLPITGGTLKGELFLVGMAPTADNSATSKSYVDGKVTTVDTLAQWNYAYKANLDSPALTGTPTAPTADAGTSTTQLATTAFVANAVSGIDMSTKMDKNNPVGTGSFAMNMKADATLGEDAFVEGYNSIASGNYSHAEGFLNTASGEAAHAEGCYTIASGNYSYAGGNSTEAQGTGSHAEGFGAKTVGNWSHAEGRGTIASSSCQHVQGVYNIEDAEGVYVHIVGNGTDNKSRSNAHTLDKSGNAWFAGKVTVGAEPTEALDTATKGYVDSNTVPSTRTINSKPLSADITLSASDVGAASADYVPTAIKNQSSTSISVWTGTQAEYDAITTKSATTLYFVTD